MDVQNKVNFEGHCCSGSDPSVARNCHTFSLSQWAILIDDPYFYNFHSSIPLFSPRPFQPFPPFEIISTSVKDLLILFSLRLYIWWNINYKNYFLMENKLHSFNDPVKFCEYLQCLKSRCLKISQKHGGFKEEESISIDTARNWSAARI